MHKRQDDVKDESGLFLKLNSFLFFISLPLKWQSDLGILKPMYLRGVITRKNQIHLFLWRSVLQMTVIKGSDLEVL
jgi:hypothetical protein